MRGRPHRATALAVLVASALVTAPALPAAAAGPVLSGRVLAAEGQSLPPLAVTMVRRKGVFETLAGAFVSLFAIGVGLGLPLLDCLEDDPALPICARDDQLAVRVGADGRFRATVPDGTGDYDVSVLSLDPQRLLLTVDAEVELDTALPDLRLWEPRAGAEAGSGVVRFGVDELPDGYADDDVDLRLALQPDRADAPFGLPVLTGSRATVDSRLLEDAPGTAVASASGKVDGVDVSWFSAPFRYPAPSGAPPSRGRGCAVGVPGVGTRTQPVCWTGDGRVVPLAPSVVTDPDPLRRPLECGPDPFQPGFQRCSRPPVETVKVDLGAVQDVGAVVVRGCGGTCLLDVSTDGRTWTPVVPVDGTRQSTVPIGLDPSRYQDAAVVVDLPDGTRGRYVRLRTPGPAVRLSSTELSELLDVRKLTAAQVAAQPTAGTRDLATLGEVSVWRLRPVAPAGGLPGERSPAALPGRDPRQPLPTGPVALAVLLLLTAGGVTSLVASRRARRRRPPQPDWPPWLGGGPAAPRSDLLPPPGQPATLASLPRDELR